MNEITVLGKPPLEFNHYQRLHDPHDGLTLFGPYGVCTSAHPKSIVYGLIGTSEGINRFVEWSRTINRAVCVVPEEIWQNCRPTSYLAEGTGERLSAHEKSARLAGQASLLDPFDAQQYEMSVDFRRQIKARVMEYGVPIQIVRETTLRLTGPTKENPRRLLRHPDAP
jgi:hypothetical protein